MKIRRREGVEREGAGTARAADAAVCLYARWEEGDGVVVAESVVVGEMGAGGWT